MKYILCGTLVCEEYEDKIPQLSNAANRFLLNFSNEIKKSYSVKFLSYIGVYIPADIKKRMKSENVINTDISYYFKSKLYIKGVVAYGLAVWQNIKKADCIIAYNPEYAYLNAPYIARIHGKKSILILADFSPKETYEKKIWKIFADLQLKAIRKFDVVIGLSENIKKYLVGRQEFIHMPGGIDRFVYDCFSNIDYFSNSGKIIFMYAGTLEKVTGIDLLLEAFEQIKCEEAELWISGKGSMLELVEKSSEKDSRVKYLGCPPYKEYLNNLKRAGVLVNPRNMNLPENRNNFPSKIMEYLATGKPVISTKFDGWNRYKDYIIFCESNKDDLEAKIRACLNLDNIAYSYENNRKFSYEFLWENQIKKCLGK